MGRRENEQASQLIKEDDRKKLSTECSHDDRCRIAFYEERKQLHQRIEMHHAEGRRLFGESREREKACRSIAKANEDAFAKTQPVPDFMKKAYEGYQKARDLYKQARDIYEKGKETVGFLSQSDKERAATLVRLVKEQLDKTSAEVVRSAYTRRNDAHSVSLDKAMDLAKAEIVGRIPRSPEVAAIQDASFDQFKSQIQQLYGDMEALGSAIATFSENRAEPSQTQEPVALTRRGRGGAEIVAQAIDRTKKEEQEKKERLEREESERKAKLEREAAERARRAEARQAVSAERTNVSSSPTSGSGREEQAGGGRQWPPGVEPGNLHIIRYNRGSASMVVLVSARTKNEAGALFQQALVNSKLGNVPYLVEKSCMGPNWGAQIDRAAICGARTPKEAIREAARLCAEQLGRECRGAEVTIGHSGARPNTRFKPHVRGWPGPGLSLVAFGAITQASIAHMGYNHTPEDRINNFGRTCGDGGQYSCWVTTNNYGCVWNNNGRPTGPNYTHGSCVDRKLTADGLLP